ncbi:MAG: hypothetical protein AAF211_06680 [Myxococcota bacterium]
MRLCADAAAGTEVEVCLRLAVAHPEELDGIAAALVAHLDRAEAPDRELLDAMLRLAGPDGVAGIARLQELGDPRAVPALIHSAKVREDPVALAAIRALATWREAWPTLASFIWGRGRDWPLDRRTAAALALVDTGDPRAAALVENAMARPGIPLEVYRSGVRALAARHPDRVVPARGLTSEASLWLTAGAGIGLSFAMAAATQTAREELDLVPVAAATGAVAGATFGWVYGRARPMEAGDGAFITVSGVSGIGVGALVGLGLFPDAPQAPFIGGIVGETIGFGVSGALRHRYNGSARDAFGSTAFASLVTAAVDQWMVAGAADPRRVRPLVDAGVATTSLALAFAGIPKIRVERRDIGVIATGTLAGFATGALVPVATERRPALVAGSTAAGAALGLALAEPLSLPPDIWISGLSGGITGGGIGVGLGLVAAPNRPGLARGLGLAFGAAGLGVGTALGRLDRNPIDDRDVVFTTVAAGWATGQGIVFARVGDQRITVPEWGGIVLATGLTAATSATLGTSLDVPVPDTLAASSIGVWGAFAGGALGRITGGRPEVWGLFGTNVGLLTGGTLVSELVGTPPLIIGVANAGAVTGSVIGGLGTAAFTRRADPILTGTLVGAVGGTVVGTALGVAWHRSGERRDIAWWPGRRGVVPRVRVVPNGTGLGIVVDRW